MAGFSYQTTYTSLNGWEYRLSMWDRNWGGATNSFNISDSGAVIKYDSKGGDSKMNPLMASTMTFEFIVENAGQQSYINSNLRPNTAQEKDIYFILEKSKSAGYQKVWGGFMISDLDTTTDESYPYTLKLEAIDGIALLKDIPFVKNALNQNAGPFTIEQTYMGYSNGSWTDGWNSGVDNTKYKKIIEVLTEAVQYSDFQGMASNTNYGGAPEISSSANWWNQSHQASYIGTEDPLWLSRMNMSQFYNVVDSSSNSSTTDYYEAMSCYDALVNICRCWGLRCFYWANRIYFIQVGLYNTDETGTTASPDNIPTKIYDIFCNPVAGINDFVGTTNLSRYQFDFNATNSGKLQRLAGTTYDEYPSIRKVVAKFPSISNENRFSSFPLIYGQTDTPHEWPHNSDGIVMTTADIGTITDPNNLDGLYIDLFMQFTNTGFMPVNQELQFTIQARPTNGNYTTQGKIPLYNADANEVQWKDVSINTYSGSPNPIRFTTDYLSTNTASYSYMNIFSSATSINDCLAAVNNAVNVPIGTTTINIVNGTVLNTIFNNILPFDSGMSGDWDFRIIAIAADTNTNTTTGGTTTGVSKGHGAASHIVFGFKETPWDNLQNGQLRFGNPNNQLINGDVYYTNQNSTQFPNTIAVVSGGSIGNIGQQTQVTLANTDSFIVEIPDTLWGDCEVNDSMGSIQVYNGTNWVYTDFLGKWGRNIVTGTDSLTELLCKETLFMQNTPSYLANYTAVVGNTEPNLSSNADYPYLVNPVSRLKDTTFNNRIFVPINLEIDTINNQTSGKWFEMSYNTSGATTTTNTNLPQLPTQEPVT